MTIQESKTIKILDMDRELSFRIKLFDVLEGLDFLENVVSTIKSNDKLAIKPHLNTLLKLACPLNPDGEPMYNTNFDLQQASSIIRNPLTIIDLAFEVLEFQEVFIKNSKVFQPLINKVKGMFTTQTLG